MKLPFSGGCVCGDVRYECGAEPLMMFNCHCRDCQQSTGAPYIPVVLVRWSSFKITKGALQHYATTRLSGRQNLRGFCAKCGSRLTGGEDPARDFLGVTASSLDDPSWFKPTMDIFVCDAQPWDILNADLPKHEHYMPRKS